LRAAGAFSCSGGKLRRTVAAATAFCVTLASGGGLLGGGAAAADLPKVVVLPYAPIYDQLPRATGDKVAELLSNELSNSEQLQNIKFKEEKRSSTTGGNPTPKRDAAALAEARERLGKSEEFIRKLKFKPAVDALEKAIGLLEAQHPYIDFQELTEAYLSLAVAYFRLNQESEGEKLLLQVVRLDPELKLDTEKYPPVFVNTFEKMARKARKAKRGAILVQPTSAGATVFLDGRDVGRAPLRIKDVIKGAHYLRVAPPGGEVWAERVDVAPDDVAKVSPDVGGGGAGPQAELVSVLGGNSVDEAVVQKAVDFAGTHGADFVVLGGVHKAGEEIVASTLLLKVSARKLCVLPRVKFDAEMLGAGIEIYKVGADLVTKVEAFGEPVSLPAKLAKDAVAPKAAAAGAMAEVSAATPVSELPREPASRAVARTEDRPAPRGERRPIASAEPREEVTGRDARRPAEPSDVVAELTDIRPRPGVRQITARPVDEAVSESVKPVDEVDKDKRGSGTSVLVWVLVGAAVLGGGAAGGVLYLNHQSKPVTGSVSVSW
jgi:hypothetical protein